MVLGITGLLALGRGRLVGAGGALLHPTRRVGRRNWGPSLRPSAQP